MRGEGFSVVFGSVQCAKHFQCNVKKSLIDPMVHIHIHTLHDSSIPMYTARHYAANAARRNSLMQWPLKLRGFDAVFGCSCTERPSELLPPVV